DAAPTYADVAPIFATKCAGCHTVGGVAPFALTSAGDAKAHAALIEAATRAGVMPPWPPGKDSKPFVGQTARRLTPAQLDLIARWVRAGAPTGTATVAPPRARPAPKGVVLEPRTAYMPHPEVGLDDYHCT